MVKSLAFLLALNNVTAMWIVFEQKVERLAPDSRPDRHPVHLHRMCVFVQPGGRGAPTLTHLATRTRLVTVHYMHAHTHLKQSKQYLGDCLINTHASAPVHKFQKVTNSLVMAIFVLQKMQKVKRNQAICSTEGTPKFL